MVRNGVSADDLALDFTKGTVDGQDGVSGIAGQRRVRFRNPFCAVRRMLDLDDLFPDGLFIGSSQRVTGVASFAVQCFEFGFE